MVYDCSGSVDMFAFWVFAVSVATNGIGSPFPPSTIPKEPSEEDQQDADDGTSGDPSVHTSVQPVERTFGSETSEHHWTRKLYSYDGGGGPGVGSLRVLQITNSSFDHSGTTESNHRVGDSRWGTTNDSIVNAKRLTAKRSIGYPNLVGTRTEPSTSVQKCLKGEVLALGVERHGGAAIDLDRIRSTVWTYSPVYLRVGT